MDKKYCPHCKGLAIKNGKQKGNQRYKCTLCQKSFQQQYQYKAYGPQVDPLIKRLLKEGCGVRSISRIIGISPKTVLARIIKISNAIKSPCTTKHGSMYEVDELWSFIGQKTNLIWITYAMERETKRIVDFFVGNKSKANIQPLIAKILLLRPKRIYTDRLNIYPALIPAGIHRRFRYCTNCIERNNLTLRTHIKRLSRRTICFSRSKAYLEAHLRIYFWGWTILFSKHVMAHAVLKCNWTAYLKKKQYMEKVWGYEGKILFSVN